MKAAFLSAKLPIFDKVNEERRIANRYLRGIKNDEITLPYVADEVVPVAVRCKQRDELVEYLAKFEIETNKHYPIPIHIQEAYKDLNIPQGALPVVEEISATELSLPLYYGMSDEQIDFVIDRINAFNFGNL